MIKTFLLLKILTTQLLLRLKGNDIFIPTKFADIKDFMPILAYQKETSGKLYVYETVCDSSEWK